MSQPKPMSMAPRRAPRTRVTTTTTLVRWTISSRLGQATLRSSLKISMRKRGRQLRRPADPEPPSRRGAARPAPERDPGRAAALPSLAFLPGCRLTARLLMVLAQRLFTWTPCVNDGPGSADRTYAVRYDPDRCAGSSACCNSGTGTPCRPGLSLPGLPSLPRYCAIFVITPAPTVRPPSRIAKRTPSSRATGAMRFTSIFTLSPGMTISTPSGRVTSPVTSVVRM